jgi:hypothetical protein
MMARMMMRHGTSPPMWQASRRGQEPAEQILERRLASGEIDQSAMNKCHQMMSKCGEMFSQQAGSPAGTACMSATTPGPEQAAAGEHEPAEATRAS